MMAGVAFFEGDDWNDFMWPTTRGPAIARLG